MLTLCYVTFTSHHVTVCDENEFKCEESGVCINDDLYCDGRSHCSDDSDEDNPTCGKTFSEHCLSHNHIYTSRPASNKSLVWNDATQTIIILEAHFFLK